MEHDPDSDLTAVAAALRSKDCDGSRTARVLRETLDQLYDGARTGRYRWDQLYKTEKTHCGTLVEINMQREFGYADGEELDFSIAGLEVDCKYSQRIGGWMIPLDVMPTEVVDAAGGCVSDGGVVPVEIVGVHPGLESAAAVGF